MDAGDTHMPLKDNKAKPSTSVMEKAPEMEALKNRTPATANGTPEIRNDISSSMEVHHMYAHNTEARHTH